MVPVFAVPLAVILHVALRVANDLFEFPENDS
jgi:hypothetical protein